MTGPESGPVAPQLLIVDILEYANGYKPLSAVAPQQVGLVEQTLRRFGFVSATWDLDAADRSRDNTSARVRSWGRDAPNHTFLYWIGHGAILAGRPQLATAASTPDDSENYLEAQVFADAIRDWQARCQQDPEAWAIIAIDTCQSAAFARRLDGLANAHEDLPPRNLMVIGTATGATPAGEFTTALRNALATDFGVEPWVKLSELGSHLEGQFQRLGTGGVVKTSALSDSAVLRPVLALPPGLPLDVRNAFEAALLDVAPSAREPVFDAARVGGLGEPAIGFVGRETERAAIVRWLREGETSMLVVHGRAGAGKSALLSDVAMSTYAELRPALVKQNLLRDRPASEHPPAHAFDLVLRLTGETIVSLCRGVGPMLGWSDPGAGSSDTALRGALLAAARRAERTWTILADSLDEAREATGIAELLRDLAATDHVRIVVGTRESEHDDPDQPAPRGTELLTILEDGPQMEVVEVEDDAVATAEYVTDRLGNQLGERVLRDLISACRDRRFLFTSLAVQEIAARAKAGADADAIASFVRSLTGENHRQLFVSAVERLQAGKPAYGALMQALGLAQGRGMPTLDGVLEIAAHGLPDGEGVTSGLVYEFLDVAASYVTMDRAHGQTVYRLAHRTFQEHFRRLDDVAQGHGEIAAALLDAIPPPAPTGTEEPKPLNPYVKHHLSAHVAAAAEEQGMWDRLAARLDVLDRLSPRAVASDAVTAIARQASMPETILGTVASEHLMSVSDAVDRPGLRQYGVARARGRREFDPATVGDLRATWRLRHAELQRDPWHRTFMVNAPVNGIVEVPRGGAGGTNLVIADARGRVRAWDLTTGEPAGVALEDRLLKGACLVAEPGSEAWVIAAGNDGTLHRWRPGDATAVELKLNGSGRIRALQAFDDPREGPMLAIAREGQPVTIWQRKGVDQLELVLTMPVLTRGTRALTTYTVRSGEVTEQIVVTAGEDGTVRVWRWKSSRDPRVHPDVLTEPSDWVTVLTAYRAPDGTPYVVAGGDEGVAWIWAPPGQGRAKEILRLGGHEGGVRAVAAFGARDGHGWRVGTADGAGVVRIWDGATGEQLGPPLTGHSDKPVAALSPCSGLGPVQVLASGGEDGRLCLWFPESLGEQTASAAVRVPAVAAGAVAGERVLVAGPRRPITWAQTGASPWTVDADRPAMALALAGGGLLAGASGEQVWTRALDTPDAAAVVRHVHSEGALCVVTWMDEAQQMWMSSGGADATVQTSLVLDAGGRPTAAGTSSATFAVRSGGRVRALAPTMVADGRHALAVAGHGRSIDLRSPAGDDLGKLHGHLDWVMSLAAYTTEDGRPHLISGADDGTVRLWDPVTASEVEVLTDHRGPVRAVASGIVSGRALLASGGEDGVVIVRDAEHPAKVLHRIVLDLAVEVIQFTGPGLVAGTAGGHLSIDLLGLS